MPAYTLRPTSHCVCSVSRRCLAHRPALSRTRPKHAHCHSTMHAKAHGEARTCSTHPCRSGAETRASRCPHTLFIRHRDTGAVLQAAQCAWAGIPWKSDHGSCGPRGCATCGTGRAAPMQLVFTPRAYSVAREAAVGTRGSVRMRGRAPGNFSDSSFSAGGAATTATTRMKAGDAPRATRSSTTFAMVPPARAAPRPLANKPRPLASRRGARSRAQRAQACGRACALPRMHLGIERSYNFHRSRALTPMMPWRDMHRAAISCQPTCRARAPVASMGSVIRTRSSASRLAGSLFRYSRACAQQHGRPSAAGRPGAHLAFTSQPDRNPGMSCPTHLVGHPQGLCVAMWAQHAPHHVFTTTVGGFEYFEAAARRCGLTACSVQRPGLQAAPAWGNPYAAQLHKTPGARAARRTPRQAAGRAARLEGGLIAHVTDMVRLGRGQHRHCLLQQHQARAQDRHHLPPCSAAVGSSAASKARFLDRTCHARSAADRWVKGEHAGPVRCSCM